MQVKQESSVSDLISASDSSPLDHHNHHQHRAASASCDINTLTSTPSHDMQTCQSGINTTFACNNSNHSAHQQQQDKSSSGYSLWAEYFDAFPVLTEFDLRSGVNGSTGTRIASSSSAPSENWSSPGSGSPFSDCEQDDTTFIDDHAVPTSVIDEIVQTLKMDGYNFDHLGDDIMDSTANTTSAYHVKQEQDLSNQQACYLQSPVYTSLSPPKLQLHPDSNAARKYVNINDNTTMHIANDNNNNNINYMNNNMNNLSIFDQVIDGKWCNNNTSLPSMSKWRHDLWRVKHMYVSKWIYMYLNAHYGL